MLKIRKSEERGQANHGWLKSFHTFSFANYFDQNHMHFSDLRVINEDFIAAGQGFGKHPHQDMEIITYVISGALQHEDSMGNSSTILPNEIQTMSAGTGVFHSEFSNSKEETHLLQIWILPDKKQIKPNYGQKSFAKNFLNSDFVLAVSGSGKDGSIAINQDVEVFIAKFVAGKKKDFEIKNNRKIWIQVISGKLSINNSTLNNGDAAAIENEKSIEIIAEKNSEFLLFNLR